MRHRVNRYSRRMKDPFKSEAALCATFVEVARAEGLKVYPETSGWDLLVVDPETGEQAGIEAKRRPNVDVLHQAMGNERRSGPSVHGVLVPSGSRAFASVAWNLRIVVIEGWRLAPHMLEPSNRSSGAEPSIVRDVLFEATPKWNHTKPLWVPEVEVDTPAGVPAPKRVTPWKMSAVKMSLELVKGLEVTRKDVEKVWGMSFHIWRERWLDVTPRKRGVYSLYQARRGTELPCEIYPAIAKALSH